MCWLFSFDQNWRFSPDPEWLNSPDSNIIGNVKNNILGIYHGVSKRNLPLFLKTPEYRFNHRNVGLGMLDKIQQYLTKSAPMKKRTIIRTLDDALPILLTCVRWSII